MNRETHRRFLNGYYRHVRHVYDASRRWFLFGRDRVLGELAADRSWRRLVEVGPGTGRNLRLLRQHRPEAHYGGVEASDEMLAHARRRCPWATLVQGFGEDADLGGILGAPPDRVLFSYSLSMMQDPARALDNARRSLAPGGEVIVVDFGDLAGLPIGVDLIGRFLRAFHVEAPEAALLEGAQATVSWGPRRYYVISRHPRSVAGAS